MSTAEVQTPTEITAITIQPPDHAAIAAEINTLVLRAHSLTIRSVDDDAAAKLYLVELKRREKVVDDELGPSIAAANTAHKTMTALRARLKAPIEAARGLVNAALDKWEAEQRAIAAEEQRRLEAIAREQEAAARKAEEDARLAEAQAAEEAGDADLAEAIVSEPAPVYVPPPVHVQPKVAQVAGVTGRTTWSGECHDLMALVRHVAAHPEDVGLLMVNGPRLNELARAQRGLMRIPGCRAIEKTSRPVRT